MKDTACPSCGAEQANDGWARVCYNCGFAFAAGGLDDGSRAALVRLLGEHRPARAVASVRAARMELAAALHAAGRHAEAAELLAQALAEPGTADSGAELHRAQAEVQLALGNVTDAQRAALMWAPADPAGGPAVIDTIRDALDRASAEELVDWLTAIWLPRLVDAEPAVRAHGLVLAAAAQALLGHGTAATDLLATAHDAEAAQAIEAWAAWLAVGTTALAAVPGGDAYAVTLRARADAALHRFEESRTLVDEVIRSGMTAEGYPELEAYWLRAELPARSAGERADDLLQVAQRYRWRGTPADLRLSIELCDRAVAYCPDSAAAYWHKTEALRLQASAGGTSTDVAFLDAALAAWDGGAARQAPTEPWALLIGSLVHRDAAEAHPQHARSWEARSLSLAVRCVSADPGLLAGWSMVATQCRRLRLWPASRWAAARALERVTAWTPDSGFEAFNVVLALLDTDPVLLQEQLPALQEAFATLPAVGRWVEVATRWSVDPSDRSAQSDMLTALDGLSTDTGRHAFDAMSSAIVGDRERATAAVAAMQDAAAATPVDALRNVRDRVAALLWTGDPRWRALRAQLDDRQLVAESECGQFDFYAAIESGDDAAADAVWDVLLVGYNPGEIALTRLEFSMLTDRLTSAGRADAAATAQMYLGRLEGLQPAWTSGQAWSASAVRADLDRRLWVDELPEVRSAIAAVSALAGEQERLTEAATAASGVAPAIALELSTDLVPLDASDDWERWTLFRDLVPAARTRIEQVLGVTASGIRVRESAGTAHAYQVLLYGRVVASGTVNAAVPEQRLPMDEWPDHAAWQEAVDATVAAVLAHRGEYLSPTVVRWVLAEAGSPPLDSAADATADQVVGLWRRLRATLDAGGVLPSAADLRAQLRERALTPAGAP